MTVDLSVFSAPQLKEPLQDLRELFSQNRVAFLFGAGCSYDAGLPLMPQLTTEVISHQSLGAEAKAVLDSLRKVYEGAHRPTIEDFMSDLVDYSSMAQRRTIRGANNPRVRIGDNDLTTEGIEKSLDEIKAGIVRIIGDREVDLSNHRRFVRSIHRSLQAGKPARTVDYFVLNYDTLVEDALGIEKVPYVDGFAGAVTGWWQPSTFDETGVGARVHKIHGSIEWCLVEGDALPRRIRSGINLNGEQSAVLIYPAATKFQEVQRDPFAQLFQRMRDGLRPRGQHDVVLAICGYGFQDSHINIEIENALLESDESLTVVAFTSEDGPEGILNEWTQNQAISPQLRIYTNRGLIHSELVIEAHDEVPWWKFEVLARILGGER